MTLLLGGPAVFGLTADEEIALSALVKQLGQVQAKNQLLKVYSEGHRAFKDLGISTPPQMVNTRAALGWPNKAVRALSRLHVFEGFTLDGRTDPFEINEILEANEFGLELAQTIDSAYTYACSFITTTPGDVAAGEPEVLVQSRDALWTTALWSKRLRRPSAFLAVIDVDEVGQISEFVLALPGKIVEAKVKPGGKWQVTRQETRAKRVLAEVFPYDPKINRPFGQSRITREVRYLTDAAIRTLVRTETSAEFFAAPQRWAMNTDPANFEVGRWAAVTGRLMAIAPDTDSDKNPTVGQFPQMSMDPHTSMYRQLAMNFCAATDLPQSSVGVFADNPASAEAMQAARADLADEGEYQWRIFDPRLRRIAQNVVMLRDGLEEPPEEAWKIGVKHKPCRYISPQAAADFTVKAVSSIPKIGQTTEALRGLGYSTEVIESMEAEWRTQGAVTVLETLAKLRPDEAAATADPEILE